MNMILPTAISTTPNGTTSRAIEFKLDEASMVATPSFEFPVHVLDLPKAGLPKTR